MADDSNHETKKSKKKHKKHKRHDESKEDDPPTVEVDNSKAVKHPSTPKKSPKIEIITEQKMAVKTNTTTHREWTFDEEERLLKEVEKFALSCDENRKLVNWSQIELEGFSQTEISEEYKKLTKKVRKYRSVREVVIDAQQLHKEKVEQTKVVHPRSLQNKGPAKPMNTFMLFCKAKRASLVEKYPKLSFAEIHKKMCERWKELPDNKREKYAKKYEKDKQRYAEELEQYHKKQLQGIKKPLSAYDMWKLERETDESNEYEIEDDYIVEWDNLPKSMRKGWMQAARSERERYESEVSCITNKPPMRKKSNKSVNSVDASTSEEPGYHSTKKAEITNDVGQSLPSKEKSSTKRKLDTSSKSDESPPKKVMKPKPKTSESESSTDSD